jgi:sugar (pentulose or hexulose) kinase
VDGTSATCLLVDAHTGTPATWPLFYNDSAPTHLARLSVIAPEGHTCRAATSTLAKLLSWTSASPPLSLTRACVLSHQADFCASLLHGRWGVSDWHNALKLGYDPATESWPSWLTANEPLAAALLPRSVLRPGSRVAPLQPSVTAELSLPPSRLVAAGTTDSNAAFLAAAGAATLAPGDAVTSLGSTLAVKMVSSVRVDDAAFGVYSHRLGDTWLAGGASSAGCAILRRLFRPHEGASDAETDAVLASLSLRIQPDVASPYAAALYPLMRPGERFPRNEPDMQPRLTPRPDDDAEYLAAILESLARIEGEGYEALHRLGGPRLRRVLTAGGGAKNAAWCAIRARVLGVPVQAAVQGEAAYGAALLARLALV